MDKVTYVARFPRSLEQVDLKVGYLQSWFTHTNVWNSCCLVTRGSFTSGSGPNAHENDVPLDYPRANCSSDLG